MYIIRSCDYILYITYLTDITYRIPNIASVALVHRLIDNNIMYVFTPLSSKKKLKCSNDQCVVTIPKSL